jgi:limonene-1,2-epoxide hydrolase
VNRFLALAALLVAALAGSEAATAAHGTASPAAVARAWSKALNENDNVAAARLFAHNARVVQPGLDGLLSSQKLAVEFNSGLPCAGKIVAIAVHGERAVATFVLGQRPKHHCTAPGVKAAALFVVHDGKITLWQQVAVPNPSPNANKPIA